MAGTSEGQGLIARVTTAMRYAIFGQAPIGWFGPLNPLPPQAPDDVRGRAFDYPVGININYQPRSGEGASFADLKRLATNPIVAMLIQRQKDKVSAIDWQIKPRAGEPKEKLKDPMIGTLTEFFGEPDKQNDWVQWIGAVLEQLMVLDATSIYAAPNRAGGIYAAQVLDGATIKPLLDYGGRRPIAPNPAFQQVIKGLPAVDYTTDELIYFPQTYRPDRVYGYSKVEQAKDLIETSIARLRSQKAYFDFGNVGDGYFTAPENWTPDQINLLETKWNTMMLGSDPALRRAAPFLPAGAKWEPTKTELLSDAYDLLLIRLLCFPFGVAPLPFMEKAGLGHGSSESEHEAAEEGGLQTLMQFVERLCSRIIAKWFGRPDLEFAFIDDREFDPKTAAEIDDIRIKNGSLLRNEARDRNGEPPLPDGDKPLLGGAGAWQLADGIVNPAGSEPASGDATAPAGPDKPGAEEAASGADSPAMTKAADAAAVQRLGILLSAYLKTKAEPIADTIASALKMGKAADMDGFERQIEEAIDGADWDWSDLPGVMQPVLTGVAAAAGQDAVSALGLFDADVLAKVTADAVAYAEARGAEMVGMKLVDGELVENPDAAWSIPEATRTMLRNLIRDAMAEGQSNQELKTSIMDSAAFSKDRASTIARTETAMADTQGAIAGWKASGVVAGKRFDAAPDCCDECQTNDGEIVPLGDDFSNGDPPVHPNCRCSMSAVLDDEMPG